MVLHRLSREDQSILLPDGRRLGYAEYGALGGRPVLFFHGAPGSRHIHADMADVVTRRGIRLIAVERPGYGLSDPQPGRSMLDWPGDVAVLADTLGIAQFSIIGVQAEPIVRRFLTKIPQRYEPESKGPMVFNSVLIKVDPTTGKAQSIERIQKILEG